MVRFKQAEIATMTRYRSNNIIKTQKRAAQK
jgi:hypothetical protein